MKYISTNFLQIDHRNYRNAEERKRVQTILRKAWEAKMTRAAAEDGPLLRDRAQDYHDYDTDNLID